MSENNKVKTGKWTLCELMKQGNITIPNYQRPYVWDTERVKILLEDLDYHISYKDKNTPEKYLLGSLILYKNNGEIEVVDGQQRLVSLALILLCLEKLGKGENATIEFLKDSKFTHNESKVHISQNYKYIQSWFSSKKGWEIEENEKHKDDIQKYRELLKTKIEFIYVKAPTLDDAFIFFDSANAKGKRLEGYDLIKAFHLRALEDTEPIQKHKEKLRAKDINPDDKDALIEHYAKYFEEFVKQDDDKNKKDIEILFNETLTPARQWLRHNSDKVSYQMDIYGEFCAEIPQRFKTQPLIAKDSLGILQNFVGGVDFFEYLSHFHSLYERLCSVEFYKKLVEIDGRGFEYNRYTYIIAVLIYLDKFPNGRVDYMLRLIARAVFALRCSESRIYIQTARDFAKEILPLIYYASFEQELEANLCSFIDEWLDKERAVEKESFDGGKTRYLEKMSSEYSTYKITPHHDKGANNEQSKQ